MKGNITAVLLNSYLFKISPNRPDLQQFCCFQRTDRGENVKFSSSLDVYLLYISDLYKYTLCTFTFTLKHTAFFSTEIITAVSDELK